MVNACNLSPRVRHLYTICLMHKKSTLMPNTYVRYCLLIKCWPSTLGVCCGSLWSLSWAHTLLWFIIRTIKKISPLTHLSHLLAMSLPHTSTSRWLHLVRRGGTMRWTDLLYGVLYCLCMVIVLCLCDLIWLNIWTISYSLVLYYCHCVLLSLTCLLSLATVLVMFTGYVYLLRTYLLIDYWVTV